MSSPLPLSSNESEISRREFLKYCGLGLGGLLLPINQVSNLVAQPASQVTNHLLGRVIQDGYALHLRPDPKSRVLATMAADSLWQITGITIGEDISVSNRVWYELDGAGYAHSRRIQPVRKRINEPVDVIPETGCLGEVSAPFVDAYKSISGNSPVVYRYYYASTMWIIDRLTDDKGNAWYELLDDRIHQKYYVPAYDIRLISDSELSVISPDVPPEEKKLVVDLATQSLQAFEGEKLVFMARISSGVRMEEGGFATHKGAYRTSVKRPCRHMYAAPSEFGTGFDLPGVPWVCYFTRDGVALHGTYWHNEFGVPQSHGCINLTPQAAKWVYRWTNPIVPPDRYYYAETSGTRIVVQ